MSRATAALLATLDQIDPSGRVAGDEVLLEDGPLQGQAANDELALAPTTAVRETTALALTTTASETDAMALTTWIDTLALTLAAGLRVGATGLDRAASAPPSRMRPFGDSEEITQLDTDAVLTVDDVAALLKVGRNVIYDSAGRGEIPHRRIGNRLRFSKAALLRWLGGDDAPR